MTLINIVLSSNKVLISLPGKIFIYNHIPNKLPRTAHRFTLSMADIFTQHCRPTELPALHAV